MIAGRFMRTVPPRFLHRWVRFGQAAGRSIFLLVFPRFCLVCEHDLAAGEHLLCDRCWSRLEMLDGPFCGRCGKALGSGSLGCQSCQEKNRSQMLVRSAYHYDEDVRKVIHAFKFQRKMSLARRLGRTLAFVLIREAWCGSVDGLIAVPLHPSRLRERGYNQSQLLADVMADELGLPCLKNVLIRRRRTRAMTSLDPVKRPDNVEGAFQVVDPEAIQDKAIVLVDDVYTTGATARACTEALHQAGAGYVFTVTLARAR